LMTNKFPEFRILKEKLPNGTVIDGEILPLKDGKILSFAEMQKRIGRKNLPKKILQDIPLAMICYDLLEKNGEDIRQWPLKERRSALEELIVLTKENILQLSPLLSPTDWKDLDKLRNESKSMGCEGLMLKHKDS